MKKLTGNIVKSFKLGATQVHICDDFCRDKTDEEVKAILDKIARDALPVLRAEVEHTA